MNSQEILQIAGIGLLVSPFLFTLIGEMPVIMWLICFFFGTVLLITGAVL